MQNIPGEYHGDEDEIEFESRRVAEEYEEERENNYNDGE